MRLILYSLAFFFQIHKSRLYLSNDEWFPLKSNDSFENWRIESIQVRVLKINVFFFLNLICNQGFVLFLIIFLCKQLYQRKSYILFSFIFFHFVFCFIPFFVPFRFLFRFLFRVLVTHFHTCCPSDFLSSMYI